MKFETQNLDDHQVRLRVEADPQEMEEAKRRAARELASRTRIPGFRPGKAPYQVVVRQFGEDLILDEAIEHLANDLYLEAIDQAGIMPYGPGSLDDIPSRDPLQMDFLVPLHPTVVLGDYRSIKLPYETPQVDEAEIDAVLKDLQERQAILEPVERPVQEGDMVTVLLSAERINLSEGKTNILIRERSAPILVRAEKDSSTEADAPEWPFIGFSRNLVGMKVGDEKSLGHTYTEEGGYQALVGAQAEFRFTVLEIKARRLPVLNDEFATTIGDFANLSELRQNIRKFLEKDALDEYHENYDEEVLEKLVEGCEIHYPPQALEDEIEHTILTLKNRLAKQNLDFETYLKARNLTQEKLEEETRPAAEKRLKKSLVLLEVAKAERIQISPDEFTSELGGTIEYLHTVLPKKDAGRLSDERVLSRIMVNLMDEIMARKAYERLRDYASGRISEESAQPLNTNEENLNPEDDPTFQNPVELEENQPADV